MESNRAVLDIPGDSRSGMSICIVVHVMKATCKYVEVLLAFAGYQQHSRGFNSSFTSARMYPDIYRPLVPAVVGQVMLGVPFIKHPLCYHSNIIFCWGLFP